MRRGHKKSILVAKSLMNFQMIGAWAINCTERATSNHLSYIMSTQTNKYQTS